MFSSSRQVALLLVLLLITWLPMAAQAAKVNYTLTMPEPHTHYFGVEMAFENPGQAYVDVKMPVWTPGSYLVREFAKNVDSFAATANGQRVRYEKVNKNTWRVYAAQAPAVKISYQVYAYELTVRTSFLNADHGYVNGASVFMYPVGLQNEPAVIKVVPFKEWKVVSTALPAAAEGAAFTFQAANYDEVVDSPIEIGNHEVWQFAVNGVPHQVAMFGESNVNKEKFLADLQKITTAAAQLMGDLPLNRYLFIVHNLFNGGGGLEHKYSTTLQVRQWNYGSPSSYHNILNLAAHEYFHLWNVKRLRPAGLGPFNYDAENYTSLLWVAEGFTSYYADLLLHRSGFYPQETYLTAVADEITSLENNPGVRLQSAAEASFDAWIKYYRPNENSPNATVSYYAKGAVLGALLNLEILKRTQGRQSLDDLMRQLYQQYYKKLDRGYTEAEFKQAAENMVGGKLDAFFNDYVYGTQTPDYATYFSYAGLRFTDQNANQPIASLGTKVTLAAGKQIVTAVTRDGSAWQGGLNVNDELLALNGYRLTDDITKSLEGTRPGQKIKLLINRDGALRELEIVLERADSRAFTLTPLEKPSPAQLKIRSSWLTGR